MVYYRPPTKLQEGNVFSRICLSVCPMRFPHVTTTIQGTTPLTPSPHRDSSRHVQTCSLGPHHTVTPPPPKSGQTCSLCGLYICQQVGSWPSTEMLSCSHCREQDLDWYRKRNWHNKKQWVLAPVPVSDQSEHFYIVLNFP